MIKRTRENGGKVFLFDDLNPEDGAMLQALYARSAAGAEPILEKIYAARREAFKEALCNFTSHDGAGDESDYRYTDAIDSFMAISGHNDASALARRIHNDYSVKYGHKSIADCGSTTLCIEGCSMLAAKAIEDSPLYSGQETSTRAVDMTKQSMIDPIGMPESKAILDRWIAFYAQAQEPTAAEVRRRYPRQESEDQKAYDNAVKYRVFDILRAFLPAGSTTNVSLHMNLRQMGDKMPWLLDHPLTEVQDIGKTCQAMLCERYPSSGTFGGGAAVSGVGVDGKEDERTIWNRAVVYEYTYPLPVKPGFRHTLGMLDGSLADFIEATDTRPRGCVLPHFMSDLGQLQFGFDIDFGSFRDVQRHRNGVCRMPLLTMSHGFETWYLDQLDAATRNKAVELLRVQEEAIASLKCGPTDKQYLVAMGFKVPVSITMGLPAFLYLAELRSTKSVHPTLRAKIHWMVDEFQKVFPEIKMHIDRDPDGWDVRRGTQTIEKK